MEVGQQTLLNFGGVDFVNVNVRLENPIPKGANMPVDLTLIPKVYFPPNKSTEFTVVFETKLSVKNYFNISIIAFGFFSIPQLNGDIRFQKGFININAPAIMFPYVRAFISTLTANIGGGLNGLVLPPHFFNGDLQEIESMDMSTTGSIQETKFNP